MQKKRGKYDTLRFLKENPRYIEQSLQVRLLDKSLKSLGIITQLDQRVTIIKAIFRKETELARERQASLENMKKVTKGN
jgi:hypothetical protein